MLQGSLQYLTLIYIKLSLIDAYVLPTMTYALEAISVTHGQYAELSACWNNLFWCIFNMHKWESVKVMQYYCGSLDFTRLCDLCRLGSIKYQFVRM